VFWYYGYNSRIGKLPIQDATKSHIPKFSENEIFWETRARPFTGTIYRDNVSRVASVKPSIPYKVYRFSYGI
jgi:hypothetical protein